jgi:hypothetical protein
VFEEFDRRHLMLADDIEHLQYVVCRVDRDRQLAFLGGAGSPAHQICGAGLDLARNQDPADAVPARTLPLADKVEREFEFAISRSFVDHTCQLAIGAADPPAAVESGAEIGANSEPFDLFKQGFLHLELTSELYKCRDAVP